MSATAVPSSSAASAAAAGPTTSRGRRCSLAALAAELRGTAVHAAAMDDESYIAVLVEHAGLPEPAARAYATFGRAIREGHLAVRSSVVEDLTGALARHVRDLLAAHLGQEPPTQAS